jgi:pimeloyl-ACP methyl ester carboxylesterase
MHRLSYLYLRLPLLNDLTWALVRASRRMTLTGLQAIFHDPKAISEDLVEKAYAASRQPGAGRAWGMVQKSEVQWQGTRTCYMDRLAEIRHPTLFVHGAQDRLVPVDLARQAHRLVRDSELYIMEGCGHWPQREKPAEFCQVVGEFLNRAPP